mgnify:CR=1 FL=1
MNSHNPMNIAADFAKHGGTARKVVALTDKGPLNGFKKFLSRGSMIDMAVGVVMGSAVTAVVNSIVDNLISPLIGMIGRRTGSFRTTDHHVQQLDRFVWCDS